MQYKLIANKITSPVSSSGILVNASKSLSVWGCYKTVTSVDQQALFIVFNYYIYMSMDAFTRHILRKHWKQTLTLKTIYNVTYSTYEHVYLWICFCEMLYLFVLTDVFTFKIIMYQNFGWYWPNCAVIHKLLFGYIIHILFIYIFAI